MRAKYTNPIAKTSLMILVFGFCLFQIGCKNSDPNRTQISNSEFLDFEGVASGGGGYAQSGTAQVLEYAKNHLADAIENTPENFFKEFPPDYNKQVIAQIIRDLKFLPTERRQRDGQYLKLDYDKKNKSLIATYDFYVIYNVSSILDFAIKGLFNDETKVKDMVQGMQKDILHEFSHLLNIGITAEKDLTSRIFAESVLDAISNMQFQCSSAEFSIKFWPYAKILTVYKGNEQEIRSDDIDDLAFSNDLYRYVTGSRFTLFGNKDQYIPYFIEAMSPYPSEHRFFDLNNQNGKLTFIESGRDKIGYQQYNYDSKEWINVYEYADVKVESELAFEKNYENAKLINQFEIIDRDLIGSYPNGHIVNELPIKEFSETINFSECSKLPTGFAQITTFPLLTIIANQVGSYQDPNIEILYDSLYIEK